MKNTGYPIIFVLNPPLESTAVKAHRRRRDSRKKDDSDARASAPNPMEQRRLQAPGLGDLSTECAVKVSTLMLSL